MDASYSRNATNQRAGNGPNPDSSLEKFHTHLGSFFFLKAIRVHVPRFFDSLNQRIPVESMEKRVKRKRDDWPRGRRTSVRQRGAVRSFIFFSGGGGGFISFMTRLIAVAAACVDHLTRRRCQVAAIRP